MTTPAALVVEDEADLREPGSATGAMDSVSASSARRRLPRLIDQVATSHRPVGISGRRHRAVLVGAEDWSGIQETLFLLSVPGMRASIRDGMATPLAECVDRPTLSWSEKRNEARDG